MLGRAQAEEIVQETLGGVDAEHAEVILAGKEVHVTRFANSAIHQNASELTQELTIRVIHENREGIATTTELDAPGVRRAAEQARRAAAVHRASAEPVALPAGAAGPVLDDRDQATADFTPDARAAAVARICQAASRKGIAAAGAFLTGRAELAVANSRGLLAYYPSTLADLHTVMVDGESTGYASRAAMTVDQVDPDELAAEALEKVIRGRDPRPLEAGAYEVVLEGYAVADMLKYFGQHAFGAPAVSEGTSFMSGRMGDRVMSEHVTIWDDGLDPNGLRQPFDFEGVPKRRVVIIDHGVANATVHDSNSARRAGTQSTGHALPPTFTYLRGPFPLNMFMAGGTAGRDDMLRSIKRGIWVSRFHYTAIVDARRMILTGLTRDGTFLIEDGRLTRPVRNLRFVQNCVDALSQVEAVGRTTQLIRTKVFRDFYSVSRVPALRIQGFTFTGMAGT